MLDLLTKTSSERNFSYLREFYWALRKLFPFQPSKIQNFAVDKEGQTGQTQKYYGKRSASYIHGTASMFYDHPLTKLSLAFNFPTENSVADYVDHGSRYPFLMNFIANLFRFPAPSAPNAQRKLGYVTALPFLFWHLALALPNLVLNGLKIACVMPLFILAKFFYDLSRPVFNFTISMIKGVNKHGEIIKAGVLARIIVGFIASIVLLFPGIPAAAFLVALFISRAIFTPDLAINELLAIAKKSNSGLSIVFYALAGLSYLVTMGSYMAGAIALGVFAPAIIAFGSQYLPAFMAVPLEAILTAYTGLATAGASFFSTFGHWIALGLGTLSPALVPAATAETLLGFGAFVGFIVSTGGPTISDLVDRISSWLHSFGLRKFLGVENKVALPANQDASFNTTNMLRDPNLKAVPSILPPPTDLSNYSQNEKTLIACGWSLSDIKSIPSYMAGTVVSYASQIVDMFKEGLLTPAAAISMASMSSNKDLNSHLLRELAVNTQGRHGCVSVLRETSLSCNDLVDLGYTAAKVILEESSIVIKLMKHNLLTLEELKSIDAAGRTKPLPKAILPGSDHAWYIKREIRNKYEAFERANNAPRPVQTRTSKY